jgi:hypothetical protein
MQERGSAGSRAACAPASFARFFAIGSALGVSALAARDAVGRLLPDSPIGYWLSIVGVYGCAVLVGYQLQGRYAFGATGLSWRRAFGDATLVRYGAVAALGAVLTSGLAVVLRYTTPIALLSPSLAGALAFAAAALAVSLVTFVLNRRYVFGKTESTTVPASRNALSAETVSISLLCGAFAVAWTYYAGQDYNWDQLNYHLYAGLMALDPRFTQDFFAASIQSYLNPYSFVPLYLMFRADWPAIAIAAALALMHAVNLVLVHRIAAVLLPGPAAIVWRVLAVVLAASAPVFLVELGSTFNDVLVSVPVLAAVWLLAKASDERQWPFVVAGLCVGIAAALKLTSLPFAVACGFAVLVTGGGIRALAKRIALLAVGGAVGFLLAGGYWGFLLWREFGNPFFPFFNAAFRSPDFAPVTLAHYRFAATHWTEALALPFRMADPRSGIYTETTAPDARYAAALLLTVTRLLLHGRREPADASADYRSARVVLSTFWVGFALWAALSGNGRYLMPLALLCGPVVAWLVVDVARSSRARTYGLGLLLAAQVLGIAVAADQRWTKAPWSSSGWFSLELPEQFARRRALYLTLDLQPAAFLAAFAAPNAGFVNLVGQHSLAPDGPGGARVLRLIDAYHGNVRVLLPRLALDGVGEPILPEAAEIDTQLAPFGLSARIGGCEYITVRGLPAVRIRRDGTARTEFGVDNAYAVFAACATAHVDPPPDWRQQRDQAAARFRPLEERCPGLFAPATAVPVRRRDEWIKFYANTDAFVVLTGRTFRVGSYHLETTAFRFDDPFPCVDVRGRRVARVEAPGSLAP